LCGILLSGVILYYIIYSSHDNVFKVTALCGVLFSGVILYVFYLKQDRLLTMILHDVS